MKNITEYSEFINERKKLKLKKSDIDEFKEFLNYVDDNMEEQPNLLRAAYDRISEILKELINGKYNPNIVAYWLHAIEQFLVGYMEDDDIIKKAEKLRMLNIESYDKLLNIIDDYNYLVSEYNFPSFKIKPGLFVPDRLIKK